MKEGEIEFTGVSRRGTRTNRPDLEWLFRIRGYNPAGRN
jgi:hypothetical protein